jgi:hypothetical protein
MGTLHVQPGRSLRRGLSFALSVVLLLAVGTTAWAAPQDEAPPAAAAPTDAPAPAPAAAPDQGWDPWGCNGCAPCDCKDYPCCACRKPKDPTCPATVNNRRFLENWRPCLCKPRCELDDWSDRLKGMSVSGRLWMNVGGQIRFRWESWRNIGFGAAGAAATDAWMLGRFRLHTDIHYGKHARVFVEGLWADLWDERKLGDRPVDVNRGELLNAFAEVMSGVGGGDGGLWGGRRELQTGQQRLVSPLDWANDRRTFQGAGAWWKQGGHAVEGWWTRPIIVSGEDFDEWNEDSAFFGVNYRNTVMNCREWEAYVLNLDNQAVNNVVDQSRWTVGGLIDGKLPNTRFDYGAEAAYQFGTQAGDDISAWMGCVTFGWRPCARHWDPRIGVGFDYASGDSDPTDGSIGTFNQLFPLAHKWLGHADVLGRQNVMAARIEGSVHPTKKIKLSAWYHGFWRADTADAAYNVAGGVLRAPGGSTARALGTELDLQIEYKIDRHWIAFVEWDHFFTGEFFKATGAAKDVDVVYLGIQGTF